MAYFTRSGAPVALEVGKAEDHGSGLSAVLNLPACEAAVNQAFNTIDIFCKEYFVQCVDCLIPAAREWINDAVQEADGIKAANEFARQLAQKERVWDAAEFTGVLKEEPLPDWAREKLERLQSHETQPPQLSM